MGSKLWFSLVVLVGGLAICAAVMAPRELGRDLEKAAGQRLSRAQHSAALVLQINARKWIDTVGQLAGDAVLVESLEQATKGPGDLTLLHKTVQDRLRYFRDKMKHVDLVLATDAKGRVIARAGLDEEVYKDGVEGFPLVADTLRGLRGDDTWSIGSRLYRVAASPVIARDRYVGALVFGQEVDGELAESMKEVLDVDVAFLLRGRVLATSKMDGVNGPGALDALRVLLDDHATELQQKGRSAPLPLTVADRRYLVVLAPFAGEAAAHKAAYALLAPHPRGRSIDSFLFGMRAADFRAMPPNLLGPIIFGVLGVLIVGLLLLRLESERPLARLTTNAEQLARGEVPRIDEERHHGSFAAIARAINLALDRLSSHSVLPSVRGPDLASVERGSAPQAIGPAPRSGSSSPTTPAVRLPQPPAAAPSAAAPVESESLLGNLMEDRSSPRFDQVVGPEAPTPAESLAAVTARAFGDQPTMLTVDSPAPVVPTAATPPAPTPALAEPLDAAVETDSLVDNSVTMPHRPWERESETREFESPTQVAQVPADLLRQSAVGAIDSLEAEFRSVFQEFIETKQRCGEATEGVTYDKFAIKLRSNFDQLTLRYACKSVKFRVYVKDGKAAVKATPIVS